MPNSQRYPDYPLDERGEIPEPMCFDLLRVFADYGGAYLWDMNGVCTMVSEITHPGDDTFTEPLDAEFEKWQKLYDEKPLDKTDYPLWDSKEEQIKFDEDGKTLAKKLYDFFKGRRTVIYYPTLREFEGTRWDAIGKPPIKMVIPRLVTQPAK